MSKYLGLFLSEATEHLEGFGKDLLALEKTPSPDVVDSLFRHAHSVKGMAASMGYEAIANLAHRVEDLVGVVRESPAKKSPELVDLLLASADAMLAQVQAVGEGKAIDPSQALYESLSRHLATLQEGTEPVGPGAVAATGAPAATASATETPASAPAAAEPPAPTTGLGMPPRFVLKLRISPSCQAPGVRAFLVQRRLSSLGNLFDLKPPLEDLRAGRIPDGRISVEVETSGGEAAIRDVLRNVPEVELTSVTEASFEPQPPAPAETSEAPRPIGVDSGRTVRVRTDLLDHFLEAVGELMLATSRLRELGKALPEAHRPPIDEGVYRLHALVKDLHDKVMAVRMTPLSTITDRLPRAARDIAKKRGREVELSLTGVEIELDRAILDSLADPLLHILRNAIDHGIEPPDERVKAGKEPRGRVKVAVRRARDRVVVEIEDDGRGMEARKLREAAVARGLLTAEQAERLPDREAFLLSCLPGVSTARDISEISGRGVGMDAVKKVVEDVGGSLEIDSSLGRGTRITLRLPLTVAVVNLLLVRVGEEIYGLPIAKVSGAFEAAPAALSGSRGEPMLAHGPELVPVRGLSTLLGVPEDPPAPSRPYVVMDSEPGRVALAVDGLLGQEEAVLKPLSRPLDWVPGLAGVTILGTGRPVFILDVPRLLS